MFHLSMTLCLWFVFASLYIKQTENLSIHINWQFIVLSLLGIGLFYRFKKALIINSSSELSYSQVWIKTFAYSAFAWALVLTSVPLLLQSFHFFHLFFFLSLLPAMHLIFLAKQKIESSSSALSHFLNFFSLVTPGIILHLTIRISSQNPFFRISAHAIQVLASLVFIYSIGVMIILNLKKKSPFLDLKNWIPGFTLSYLGFLVFILITRL